MPRTQTDLHLDQYKTAYLRHLKAREKRDHLDPAYKTEPNPKDFGLTSAMHLFACESIAGNLKKQFKTA